ncbi:beta strand repeat-containing protein, partial [Flavobacterium sedimenticola]|nr:hypothetical protein [Flavobacterium sedimenticola]
MKKIYFYLLLVNLLCIGKAFSQGADCSSSEAFCAGGSGLTFQNSTNVPNLGTIGCLATSPNAGWFYLQIGIAGNINLTIQQTSNGGGGIDVDYAAWGPYANLTNACVAINNGNGVAPGVVPGQPATQTTGCSYSTAAIETLNIPNAQVGQIYVVLITNFSNQAGTISLTQTNAGAPGAGATDCNIICPLSLDDQVICVGGQAILTATIAGATTYQWSGPSGPIPGNTQSITVTQPGTYTVVVNKPGCVANATASATVSYYAPPPINPPANLTQCANLPTYNLNNAIANLFTGTSLNPSDFEVFFHTTSNGAANVDNSIPNPSAYPAPTGGVGACSTIYISVTDNGPTSSGCISVFSFTICNISCQVTADPPPNLTLCESSFGSGTANFNFAPQTPIVLGTNSAADYTVTYHLSQNDADNDANAISPITSVPGTNGQTIYVRLEENANPLTYDTTSFQLIVNPLPTATISGTTTICSGTNTVITFNGTPNATVTYTVDGGPNQPIVLDGTGTNSVTTPNLTANSTYTLVSVLNNTTNCTRTLTGSATVTVSALPTATISGTTTVCLNAASPSITFTGAGGTAPYTFTYTINNVAQPPVTTTAGNSVSVSVPTNTAGNFAYSLVSVQSSGTPSCSQNQTGTATVTVNSLPTASISGTTSACLNSASPQVVLTGAGGTAPYTFVYAINTVTQPAVQSSGTTYIINVPTDTAGTFTYSLVSVQEGSVNACGQAQTGSATVTVNTAPVISTPTD